MPADVNLNVRVDKKGDGDKEAALGLEVVAKAADNAKDQLSQLDRKLLETRAAMVAAGRTFTETGDISPFKQLLKDQREINSVRKVLTGVVDDAEKMAAGLGSAGAKAGHVFSDGIFKGVKSIGTDLVDIGGQFGESVGKVFGDGFFGAVKNIASSPIGFGVLATVAVSSLAGIGAAINAAVLGGVGLGAIATGLALQFKSPEVKGAASELGAYIKGQLTQATSGFAAEASQGFLVLRRDLAPVMAQLQSSLSSLNVYVGNLFARLGEGLQKLGPGLSRAIEAAGPVIGRIAADLPMLLNGVNIFFDQISKGSKGATEAIDVLFRVWSGGIAGIGYAVRALSDAFDFLLQAELKIANVMAKIPGTGLIWGPIRDQLKDVADSFDTAKLSADGTRSSLSLLGGTASTAAQDMAALNQKIDDYVNKNLSADQSNLAANQSLLDLDASVKQHGTSLKENTADGIANRQAIDNTIGAFERQRQAAIDAAGGQNASKDAVDAANAKFNQQIQTLVDHANKLFHDKGAVGDLIKEIAGIPNSHMTNIDVIGIAQAEGGLSTVARYLNSLPSEKRISIISTYYTLQGTTPGGSAIVKVAQRYGGVVAAAQGTIVDSPTVLFGERGTGMEAYIPKLGISDQRGLALADQAASWHGGRVVRGGSRGPKPVAARQMTVTHRVVIEEPSGRRLGELIIQDSNNGGTAFDTYIRRTASR